MNEIAFSNTNQLYVVIGGATAAGHLLDLAARLAIRGPMLLLDCGNRANPLPLVRELRRLTNDPARALDNIQSARAFNCYQVTALIENTANRPIQNPVLIFDLLAAFYDESVPYREGRRLLDQSLSCMTRIRRSAPLVVSARLPPADFPERKAFLEMLCRVSDQVWTDEILQVSSPQQLSFL